jgi:pSer/pThr/pTyr-binding forkhead associated (FHA) protein
VPRLKVMSGPAAGRTVEVDQEFAIGRDRADLTIPDPEMSRRHALIRPLGQGISVEDLGSTNGTFVNGSRITAQVTLTAGDTIRLGGTEIQVELELPGPPSPVPGARGTVRRVTEDEPWATDAPAESPPGGGEGRARPLPDHQPRPGPERSG